MCRSLILAAVSAVIILFSRGRHLPVVHARRSSRGLWLKSLRPASAVGPWAVAATSGVHVVVYWIVFVVLSQMCGNGWLSLPLFLIGGPLVYVIGYRWLLAQVGPATYRNLLIAPWHSFAGGGFGEPDWVLCRDQNLRSARRLAAVWRQRG